MNRRHVALIAAGLIAIVLLAWAAAQQDDLSLERQLVLARNTFGLALEVSILATAVGLLVALIWLKTNTPLRRFGLVWLLILMFVPLYVQASGWLAGFGQLGWYTVGRQSIDAPVLSGWNATVWVHVAYAVPWATLILGVGLAAVVSRDSEEAALLETGPWGTLRSIIVPQIRTWIVLAAIWIAVSAAAEMVVVDLFQIDTYARHLYWSLAQATSVSNSFAVVMVPSCLAVVLVTLTLWFVSQSVPAGLSELSSAPLTYSLKKSRWIAWLLMLLVVGLLSVVPLANLIYQVGYHVDESRHIRWSPGAALHALNSGRKEFRDEIKWTFIISTLATTVALKVAIGLVALIRKHLWLQPVAWLFAAILVALPGPLLGLWLIPIMNQSGSVWLSRLHNETVFSPVLACALRILPLLFVICWFADRDISQDVLELSEMDAASWWKRLVHITAPQLWRVWVLSWLIGFALASGELAATSMVLPPGAATVATRVYGLIHSGVREKEAALCLWHGAFCIVLIALALRVSRFRQLETVG